METYGACAILTASSDYGWLKPHNHPELWEHDNCEENQADPGEGFDEAPAVARVLADVDSEVDYACEGADY